MFRILLTVRKALFSRESRTIVFPLFPLIVPSIAIGVEICLKFKEICQEQIEPFSSAEVMHGPKSLIQNSFKLFTLSLNDPSGSTVLTESQKLRKLTNKVYSIGSKSNKDFNLSYNSLNSPELDSIIVMSIFYAWFI